GVRLSTPISASMRRRDRLSTIITSAPFADRCRAVGHPQKPSPPNTMIRLLILSSFLASDVATQAALPHRKRYRLRQVLNDSVKRSGYRYRRFFWQYANVNGSFTIIWEAAANFAYLATIRRNV